MAKIAAKTATTSSAPDLVDQILSAWRVNNDILLSLVQQIPEKGMAALPAGSKGRDVRAQVAHLHRVRTGWVRYQTTGQYPQIARYDKTKPPTKAQLVKAVRASGREVEQYLQRALRGELKTRMFKGSPVRWMSYLIAHDSHHRGQILLALKQSGLRMPPKIAIDGVWGRWFSGA